MGLQLLAHPPVKEFLTVKTGQPVVAELIDHRSVFAQADDTGDAMQDDLRPIWFGNEIRRSMSCLLYTSKQVRQKFRTDADARIANHKPDHGILFFRLNLAGVQDNLAAGIRKLHRIA